MAGRIRWLARTVYDRVFHSVYNKTSFLTVVVSKHLGELCDYRNLTKLVL